MTKYKICGGCEDFLCETSDGMGICAIRNELMYCGSRCIYEIDKNDKE